MGDGAIHVVLFVFVVAFEGVDADFAVGVDVRNEVEKVVSEDGGERDSEKFHAVVCERCVKLVRNDAYDMCDGVKGSGRRVR